MKRNTPNTKELVTLRSRPTKNGGQSLYLDYTLNGIRIREFLKMYLVPGKSKLDNKKNEETLKIAETLKAKKIIDIQNGVAGIRKKNDILLDDYIEQRQLYYRYRGSLSTAQSCSELRRHCKTYRKGDVRLSQIDKAYIVGFIEYLRLTNLGAGSQHRIYMILNIILNTAVREDLIPENPSRKVEPSIKPKEPLGKREYLTLEELQ